MSTPSDPLEQIPTDAAEYLDGPMPNYAEPLWPDSKVGTSDQEQPFLDESDDRSEWREDKL